MVFPRTELDRDYMIKMKYRAIVEHGLRIQRLKKENLKNSRRDQVSILSCGYIQPPSYGGYGRELGWHARSSPAS